MRKQKKIDIADSNIANLGTDLEKNVRKAAAEKEIAWKGLGEQVGLHIWRIEKFHVVEWPKEDYGTFCIGDSYIVLNIYKKSEDSLKLSFDIHFWLGSETSQDEAGTAAYKTVELDDFLGTDAVQFREVQEHESRRFQALFPRITLREGGVDSGFTHVETTARSRSLFFVKSNVDGMMVKQVPMKPESLNAGDVFILDGGDQLFQFHGIQSSMKERTKGMSITQAIKEDNPEVDVIVLDQECMSKDDGDWLAFFALLGVEGGVATIPDAIPDPEARVASGKRLYRLTDGEPVKQPEKKVGRKGEDKEDLGPFDAKKDANRLRKVLKKTIGCDHKTIISIIGNATLAQREELKKAYNEEHNRDLLKDIQKEVWLASNYKSLVQNLLLSGCERDAVMLNHAMKGPGCNEDVLVEILSQRTNEQMKYLRKAYADLTSDRKRKVDGKVVDAGDNALAIDVESEIKSFHPNTKKLLLKLIEGQRKEQEPTMSGDDVHAAAKALLEAGEKKWLGTDDCTTSKWKYG